MKIQLSKAEILAFAEGYERALNNRPSLSFYGEGCAEADPDRHRWYVEGFLEGSRAYGEEKAVGEFWDRDDEAA